VLSLPPFSQVSPDDFSELLSHLIQLDHIQKIDHGGLIIGLIGERIVRSYKFFAVFQGEIEYKVKCHSKEIGTIQFPQPVESKFVLAGKNWKVVDLDIKSKIIYVKEIRGVKSNYWQNDRGFVTHNKIIWMVKQVLFGDEQYQYLSQVAMNRLEKARKLAQKEISNELIVEIGENEYCFFPWIGSVILETLVKSLKFILKKKDSNIKIAPHPPYFMIIKSELKLDDIRNAINLLSEIDLKDIKLDSEDLLTRNKFDEYIPEKLLIQAYLVDYLDFSGLRSFCKKKFNLYKHDLV